MDLHHYFTCCLCETMNLGYYSFSETTGVSGMKMNGRSDSFTRSPWFYVIGCFLLIILIFCLKRVCLQLFRCFFRTVSSLKESTYSPISDEKRNRVTHTV